MTTKQLAMTMMRYMAVYYAQDLRLMGIDITDPTKIADDDRYRLGRHDNDGENRTMRANKTIATRKALYGETKMSPLQVSSMKVLGDNVRETSVEKRGAKGRAN